MWLHLNHDDPSIGRVRAQRPDALIGDLRVLAFAVPPAVDRQELRDSVESILNDQSTATDFEPVIEAAQTIVSRLRERLDQPT
jgi:hypothetical protein